MTPFMNLDLPVPTVTLGPEWAYQLNVALTSIDEHDHSTGKGTAITPAGLNINTSLQFNDHDAIELRSTRYQDQASPLADIADISCLYVSSGDLYYNNGAGTAIQLTAGAGLNATSIGGIGGDFATSSAAVTYSNTSKAFRFTQASGINAHLDVANVSIREAASSANAVTLKSPTSLGASYNWLFPTALPSSGQTKFLTIDSSGQVGAQYDVDGTSIEVSTNTVRIKAGGVSTAKLADGILSADATGRAKMADSFVNTAKIADAAVTPAKLTAPNYVISSATGSFATTSTSFVDVTNLSASITTNGRPVRIQLISDGTSSGNNGYISSSSGTSSTSAIVLIKRGSTTIAELDLFTQVSSGISSMRIPASSVSHFEVPAAGTYTYSIQTRAGSSTTVAFKDIKLVVFEE